MNRERREPQQHQASWKDAFQDRKKRNIPKTADL